MSEKPENPPAFPCPETEFSYGDPGMSMRDHVAVQLLAAQYGAMMGNAEAASDAMAHADRQGSTVAAEMAKAAFNIAEAFLAERAKREG